MQFWPNVSPFSASRAMGEVVDHRRPADGLGPSQVSVKHVDALRSFRAWAGTPSVQQHRADRARRAAIWPGWRSNGRTSRGPRRRGCERPRCTSTEGTVPSAGRLEGDDELMAVGLSAELVDHEVDVRDQRVQGRGGRLMTTGQACGPCAARPRIAAISKHVNPSAM